MISRSAGRADLSTVQEKAKRRQVFLLGYRDNVVSSFSPSMTTDRCEQEGPANVRQT